MADVVEVRVTGLRELQEALEEKPLKIAKRIMRQVLRKAANIWRLEMKRTAPRDTEFLADHIGMKASVRGDELEGSVQVGPVRKAFYALFLEFGTRKMRAKPFIRQSYEAKKQEVLDTFIDEAKKIVEEETR